MKLVVLISLYNGKNYIYELINSLLSQTYDKFDIYIRDDGSIDNSLDFINDHFGALINNRIFLFKGENIGFIRSFHWLLNESYKNSYTYYMLCDQDDVWLNKKIEVMIDFYLNKSLNDETTPELVYSDMYVSDENLNIVHNSFQKFQKNLSIHNNWRLLVAHNCIPGCCMFFNKKVVSLIVQHQFYEVYHDWFIAVITSRFGKIYYLEKPLMYYRNHDHNIEGVHKNFFYYLLRTTKRVNISIPRLFKFCKYLKISFTKMLTLKLYTIVYRLYFVK